MVANIEAMMRENEKLVYYFYNKLPHTELCATNKDDIIQEGMIGLWKGCKSFDETKGYKLTTYLSRCINNEMFMYLRKLNKQPQCISIDNIVSEDFDGNVLTIEDCIKTEANDDICDINEYIEIYFNHYRFSKNTQYIISTILQMLLDGATQTEIANELYISRSNVSRYIMKLREAIKLESNK